MIASRISKVFQFIALVLALSVFNVYVMAGHARTPTDPRTTDSSANQPKSEKIVSETNGTEAGATTLASASSEKMPVTAGTKSVLNRIFSKKDIVARAATQNTFFNTKTSFAETFKAPAKYNATAPQSSDDGGDNGRRGTWIAVGVIAAVLVVAVIALRHDRSNPNAASGL